MLKRAMDVFWGIVVLAIVAMAFVSGGEYVQAAHYEYSRVSTAIHNLLK